MNTIAQNDVSITVTRTYYNQLMANAFIVDKLRKALDSGDMSAYGYIDLCDKLLNGEREKYDIRGYANGWMG